MSSSKKHIHKYILRPTEGRPVWACALMGCNHYMPAHLSSLVIGRTSICWECEQPFQINTLSVKDVRPKCEDCGGTLEQIKQLNERLTNIK
jgi:hypothetical protein